MAGYKGRFTIRGEDGKVRSVGGCQSASQAIKKFIIKADAPEGFHGAVWRQGEAMNVKNFRVTSAKIIAAASDLRQKKRYLND